MQTFYYPMLFFYKSTPLKYISGMFFRQKSLFLTASFFTFSAIIKNYWCPLKLYFSRARICVHVRSEKSGLIPWRIQPF